MYRALTLKVLEKKIDLKDTTRIIEIAHSASIDLTNSQEGNLKIFLDGQDVTDKIRQPLITQFVSDIAKIKDVREVMLGIQRRLGKSTNAVLDGRDIGTVVFPDADKKFYIDADFAERVERRYKELRGLGQDVDMADVESDLRNRDNIDSTRDIAPLKRAEDAIYIDTTNMTIEEAVNRILESLYG